MRFDCFFWDYDGTLMDSYPRILRSFVRGAKTLGIEGLDMGQLMSLAKDSLGKMASVIAAEHGSTPQALKEAYRSERDAEGYAALSLYEGTAEILRAIQQRGGQNYLYTHSGNEVMGALEHFGIHDCFADFITSENGFAHKPAPDALLHLMQKHGLDPSRCIMVGDRAIDVECGHNAGMAGALFDPDGFYADYQTTWRFASMGDMQRVLVVDGQ